MGLVSFGGLGEFRPQRGQVAFGLRQRRPFLRQPPIEIRESLRPIRDRHVKLRDRCGAPVGFVGTPAFFNFFRPSGPNPSFATGVGLLAPQCAGSPDAFGCGFAVQQALAQAAGYPVGFGVPVPWNSVDAQRSDGNSIYNALTFNLSKRFSRGFELLSSYTYSHSIDDSTDLQSPLEPQDSRFPRLERANSVNDQRHRWVTSAVFQSLGAKSGDGFFKKTLARPRLVHPSEAAAAPLRHLSRAWSLFPPTTAWTTAGPPSRFHSLRLPRVATGTLAGTASLCPTTSSGTCVSRSASPSVSVLSSISSPTRSISSTA